MSEATATQNSQEARTLGWDCVGCAQMYVYVMNGVLSGLATLSVNFNLLWMLSAEADQE